MNWDDFTIGVMSAVFGFATLDLFGLIHLPQGVSVPLAALSVVAVMVRGFVALANRVDHD